ncbi:enoyl-CoA hydratase/isomerase family protein [Streptomyces sp. ISL-98]|uniref:enoyl-CoA-hydratase DpgB n=1 Tax=Streptomyces sp. ISL-98 TaxID=2819192 RepID=UPI001BEBD066|nr:enoyl-CoA-hydratase DpgB [Streptomyces sp. ISL-98]MBT2505648.1 enoyl-CoA hydratase/isomerase family protein [Streptomyces sp. ISL-98]
MLTLWIDGTAPLSAETVKAVEAVCDKAEDQPQDAAATGVVTVHVAGTPQAGWTSGLSVALVTKWERVLRRLERLPTPTVAVASEDIGGAALDAFLATDFRIATRESRLLVATDGEATWPGMAAYRLVQQAGAAKIRRAVMFGLPIPAPEALTLGIVDELADDAAGVLEATTQLVGRLSGSELAIRRQLLFNATSTSFEDALGPHLAACDRALRRVAAAEAS